MSSYSMSEEVQEILENRRVFDDRLLRKELIKSGVLAGVLAGVLGVGIYYMYKGKVKELEEDSTVKTIEIFEDEEGNIVSREDIENGTYSIDLDKTPHTTIVEEGEMHSYDPETYKETLQVNSQPISRRPTSSSRGSRISSEKLSDPIQIALSAASRHSP